MSMIKGVTTKNMYDRFDKIADRAAMVTSTKPHYHRARYNGRYMVIFTDGKHLNFYKWESPNRTEKIPDIESLRESLEKLYLSKSKRTSKQSLKSIN